MQYALQIVKQYTVGKAKLKWPYAVRRLKYRSTRYARGDITLGKLMQKW